MMSERDSTSKSILTADLYVSAAHKRLDAACDAVDKATFERKVAQVALVEARRQRDAIVAAVYPVGSKVTWVDGTDRRTSTVVDVSGPVCCVRARGELSTHCLNAICIVSSTPPPNK